MKISTLHSEVSINGFTVKRPTPITGDIEIIPFERHTPVKPIIDAILDGYVILIVDFYSSGLLLLNALKKKITRHNSNHSFREQRDFRQQFFQYSNQILVEIESNKLYVKKSPSIGWLQKLYPDVNDFLLPFTQVQGLNSSWQWYKKGISLPVLKHKIHPYFGTYFPTRFEHLFLFEEWLKKYDENKDSAIDVGTGNGILGLQLLNHGFKKITGTDLNPNAIIGLNETIKKEEISNFKVVHGDLFAHIRKQTNLIVFNPPWLPGNKESNEIDRAIYYTSSLFDRFFSAANQILAPNGKIVILFSNLAQITKTEEIHPIQKEIDDNGRFEKELLLHKKVKAASKYTRRNQSWREKERIELWVLKKNNK